MYWIDLSGAAIRNGLESSQRPLLAMCVCGYLDPACSYVAAELKTWSCRQCAAYSVSEPFWSINKPQTPEAAATGRSLGRLSLNYLQQASRYLDAGK